MWRRPGLGLAGRFTSCDAVAGSPSCRRRLVPVVGRSGSGGRGRPVGVGRSESGGRGRPVGVFSGSAGRGGCVPTGAGRAGHLSGQIQDGELFGAVVWRAGVYEGMVSCSGLWCDVPGFVKEW